MNIQASSYSFDIIGDWGLIKQLNTKSSGIVADKNVVLSL